MAVHAAGRPAPGAPSPSHSMAQEASAGPSRIHCPGHGRRSTIELATQRQHEGPNQGQGSNSRSVCSGCTPHPPYHPPDPDEVHHCAVGPHLAREGRHRARGLVHLLPRSKSSSSKVSSLASRGAEVSSFQLSLGAVQRPPLSSGRRGACNKLEALAPAMPAPSNHQHPPAMSARWRGTVSLAARSRRTCSA